METIQEIPLKQGLIVFTLKYDNRCQEVAVILCLVTMKTDCL